MRESLYTQVIIWVNSILLPALILGYMFFLGLKVLGWYTDSNDVINTKCQKASRDFHTLEPNNPNVHSSYQMVILKGKLGIVQ